MKQTSMFEDHEGTALFSVPEEPAPELPFRTPREMIRYHINAGGGISIYGIGNTDEERNRLRPVGYISGGRQEVTYRYPNGRETTMRYDTQRDAMNFIRFHVKEDYGTH